MSKHDKQSQRYPLKVSKKARNCKDMTHDEESIKSKAHQNLLGQCTEIDTSSKHKNQADQRKGMCKFLAWSFKWFKLLFSFSLFYMYINKFYLNKCLQSTSIEENVIK